MGKQLKQEMEMNDISVSVGDIFNIANELCRVIETNYEYTFVIGIKQSFIEKFDTGLFLNSVQKREYVKEPMALPTNNCELSAEELQRIQRWVDIFEQILTDQYPAWSRLLEPRYKKPYFQKGAELMHVSKRHFARKFVSYLRSGRNMYSLVDNRHFNKFCEQSKDLTEEEIRLQEALQYFKKTLSVTAAHHYLLQNYYRTIECVDGVSKFVLLSKEKCISYKKVYTYISKNLGGRTIKQYINGEKDFRNNQRLLTGNARTGLLTIGQIFQLDECELAVTIVSEQDSNKIIGKPIVHCAFDPFAQMIVAINVGLKNNSYSGFCDLMMTMLEPHCNQTLQVGVECTDDIFPSLVLPKEIRADHGSEYESKALQRAALELGIKTSLVPVAAGSYKGGVENVFMRLQHLLKNTLREDGYILPENNGGKNARTNACLTLTDIRKIVYQAVLDINQAVLPGYSLTKDMIEADVAPSPVEIWRYEVGRCGNPVSVTEQNRQAILFALLSNDKKFKLTRAGIEYTGHMLRYFIDEEWFTTMLREKNPELDIRYDDQKIDMIYVRYKKQIHVVPLSIKREELESFKGMSWHEYEELHKIAKQKKQELGWKSLERRLETEESIRKTAKMARLLQANDVNQTDNIKQNRKSDAKLLTDTETETRNRLLEELNDTKDNKVVEPTVPEPDEIIEDEVNNGTDLLSLLGDDE